MKQCPNSEFRIIIIMVFFAAAINVLITGNLMSELDY